MATILLVEDDATIRDIVKRMIERKGHRVIFATNGEEGLALAQSAAPALILMDMRLPILDGWQATQQLKADPETHSIPIIALTSQGLARDR
ncbi:MAG: response regulator, partial [Chloroflexota bacterium]